MSRSIPRSALVVDMFAGTFAVLSEADKVGDRSTLADFRTVEEALEYGEGVAAYFGQELFLSDRLVYSL